MRNPTPAYLVTSVVIALAASAVHAQTAARNAPPARAGTSVANTAPTPTANTSNPTTTAPATAKPRVTGVPTTTPTTTGNSAVLTNSDGSISTTTLNADGTRTIVTEMPDGTKTTSRLPENLFNPGVINGTIGGVTVDGERLVAEPNGAPTVDTRAAFEIQERALISTDVQRSSASLDRVIKNAEKDRKKVGKNGQLLHSITPRTNVDRSDEMRDDGPTPALSGLSNSLTRR